MVRLLGDVCKEKPNGASRILPDGKIVLMIGGRRWRYPPAEGSREGKGGEESFRARLGKKGKRERPSTRNALYSLKSTK